MTPQEFVDHWGVTRAELRQLLNKSKSTVDQWFSEKSEMAAPLDVQKHLQEIHTRFLQWDIETENIPEVRQLYELIRDRRNQPD